MNLYRDEALYSTTNGSSVYQFDPEYGGKVNLRRMQPQPPQPHYYHSPASHFQAHQERPRNRSLFPEDQPEDRCDVYNMTCVPVISNTIIESIYYMYSILCVTPCCYPPCCSPLRRHIQIFVYFSAGRGYPSPEDHCDASSGYVGANGVTFGAFKHHLKGPLAYGCYLSP